MSTTFDDLSGQLQRDLEERERRMEDARLKAAQEMGYDEGLARRVINTAEFTGLPHEVVAADIDNLEGQIKRDEFDPDKYRKSAPAWTEFLSENPYHMAALEADTENMGYLERSVKQIGLGWDATWDQVEMAEMQNIRIAQGGEFTPEQEERYKKLTQTQVDHEFGAEGVAGFLVKTAKFLGPTLHSMKEGIDYGIAGAITGATAVGIAGQVGPQIALPEELATMPIGAAVGFKIGATVGAGQAAHQLERGFAYGEYRDLGFDHETATMAANTVGVVNASLELVGIGKAVKYLPWMREGTQAVAKRITGDVLTRPTMRRATATAMMRFGEVLGTEIVTEVLQESVTMGVGQAFDSEKYGLTFDMFVDRVAETAIETLQGAFLISAIGPGMSYYGDVRRAQTAQRMQNVWETAHTGAKNSTTRKNNRSAYQSFVQRLREQGMTENVYVDAERFTTYFQENGRDADAVAESMGVDVAELEEAREVGGDVAIPVDQYADKLAPTQAGMDLAADLKGSVDAMSANEANLWAKNNPGIIEQIEKMTEGVQESAQDAKIEQIVQDVTGQLVATGFHDAGSAAKLAQIMRGVGVIAQRNNMDPIDLYERVFGGVRRVTPEAKAATENVDMLIDPLLNNLRNQNFPTQRDMFGPSLLDFINESGGIDISDPELAAMDFELGARDLGYSKAKMDRWREEGGSTATLAELAAEQGYIVNRDENQLVEALRREIAGEPVYGSTDAGSAGLRDVSAKMEELAEFINQAGLDIENMTNDEVREALAKRDTFLQIDTEALEALTEQALNLVGVTDIAEGADTTLSSIAAQLPMLDDTQDFGDLTFTDTVRIQETGETAKVKVSAQQEFDSAVERKKAMKQLLDCVSG